MDLYKRYVALNFFIVVASSLLGTVIGPYLKSLGYGPEQLGLLTSVMPIALILLLPFVGNFSDKIGKRKLILYALLFSTIWIYLFMTQTHIWYLIIARFIEAIAGGTLTLLVLSRMEDVIPNKKRGEKSGVYLAIGSVPLLLFPVIGGLLADTFFVKFPMYISLILFSLILIVYAGLPEKKERTTSLSINWWSSVKSFLQEPQLRVMAFLGVVKHLVHPLTMLFLPVFLVSDMGFSYSSAGLLLAISLVMHIFQGVFGKLGDIHGHYKYVILGYLIVGTSMVLIWWNNSYVSLMILMFTLGLGNSIWNVNAWALMSTIGEKKRLEGSTTHSYTALSNIGAFIGFIVSGYIYAAIGFGGLALVFGLVMLATAIPSYLIFRKLYTKKTESHVL